MDSASVGHTIHLLLSPAVGVLFVPGTFRLVAPERMFEDEGILHGPPRDQVFVDDPLEDRWIALAIPGAIGVDDGDRSTLAHPQTVGLGSQNASSVRQAQLLEPALEKSPRDQASLLLTTLRCRLIAAQQDVTSRHVDTDRRQLTLLAFGAPALDGWIGHGLGDLRLERRNSEP